VSQKKAVIYEHDGKYALAEVDADHKTSDGTVIQK
jgi:hypothetical protein